MPAETPMTVAALIERLSQLPADAPVEIAVDSDQTEPVRYVESENAIVVLASV